MDPHVVSSRLSDIQALPPLCSVRAGVGSPASGWEKCRPLRGRALNISPNSLAESIVSGEVPGTASVQLVLIQAHKNIRRVLCKNQQ